MTELERLCRAYLDDQLPARERMALEQRISNGDSEVIETIGRLQAFQDPAKQNKSGSEPPESLDIEEKPLSAYVTESDEKANPSEQPTGSNRGQANVFEISERQKSDSFNRRIVTISAILSVSLILVLIYFQWTNFLLEKENDVLADRVEKQTERIEELESQARNTEFKLGRIQSVLQSKLVEFVVIEGDNEIIDAISMLWDKSTQRTVMVLKTPILPDTAALDVWSQNARTRDWSLAGRIDRARTDSLYMTWDGDAFVKSAFIEVRLSGKAEQNPTRRTSKLIGRKRMPR